MIKSRIDYYILIIVISILIYYTFIQIFGKEYKIIKIINNFFKILNKKI